MPSREGPPLPGPEILTIQRVGARGDGVTPDGRFVPFTLPGERVEARREGDGLVLAQILEPSPERVAPPCPHFGPCGGCALQHWDLAAYRAWKVDQVRDLLTRARMEAPVTLAFAAEPRTRRRLALHARRGKGGAVIGFKERRSWSLAPIEVCPIADPRIEAAFPALRRLAQPCLAHPKSAPILHVTLTETGLDVDISGVMRGTLSADARLRLGKAAREADFARVTVDGEIAYQARSPVVRFGGARVALPPGGFLQAVAGAEQAMGDLVLEATAGARRVADLYGGAGAFTFRLAEQASVIAADASAEAIAALRTAQGTATGLKPIAAEARDLDRRPLLPADLAKMDAVVFDPPRAGAAVQSAQIAASKVPVVVAVSCNAATFVRDAETLTAGGFRLQRVAVVDQFLWSPHIELVARFCREGDFQKS